MEWLPTIKNARPSSQPKIRVYSNYVDLTIEASNEEDNWITIFGDKAEPTGDKFNRFGPYSIYPHIKGTCTFDTTFTKDTWPGILGSTGYGQLGVALYKGDERLILSFQSPDDYLEYLLFGNSQQSVGISLYGFYSSRFNAGHSGHNTAMITPTTANPHYFDQKELTTIEPPWIPDAVGLVALVRQSTFTWNLRLTFVWSG